MTGGASSSSNSLDAVADELYGLPASEFTAARDGRGLVAARLAGDRELAAEIKKLRRPTASAWLTNQLVRQRRDEITALLRVGSALRDAQTQLAREDLRRLSQLGQQAVTALGREARRLGEDQGQRVGEDTIREVEDTLRAALADPAASDALAVGRLTSALHYSGFGTVDAAPPPPARPASGQEPTAAEVEKRAAQEAHAELATAGKEVGEQQRRLDKARQQQERLDRRVRRMSEELDQLRAEATEATAAVRDAERAFRAAERRLARAETATGGRRR